MRTPHTGSAGRHLCGSVVRTHTSPSRRRSHPAGRRPSVRACELLRGHRARDRNAGGIGTMGTTWRTRNRSWHRRRQRRNPRRIRSDRLYAPGRRTPSKDALEWPQPGSVSPRHVGGTPHESAAPRALPDGELTTARTRNAAAPESPAEPQHRRTTQGRTAPLGRPDWLRSRVHARSRAGAPHRHGGR